MGIKGLHKGLNFCTKKQTLREFRGQAVAVDSSSWLHRSVYSISERYVESMERQQLDPSCVQTSSKYMINRCRELLNIWQIEKVYLVMDGKRCPLKAVYEAKEREGRRQANLKEARMFKQQGKRDKAEEKYKMCIKIRDQFTFQVMHQVSRAFHKDDRVELVWSPYEADAQLVKLCMDQKANAVITEDSDVLVYSAAAQVAFPVLFKLDRQSGRCDVISMDWLISSSASQSGKTSNGLEGLLLNFASREARRPGFGVRLFIQGCVLAGCDYAPNILPGVGLVNAFKLIRDNSFRNDCQRFQKILDSLSRKVKNTINLQDYELTLTKSEAVFYYHVVAHLDGSSAPIAKPRITKGEHGDEHHVTDHSPFLNRFDNDWSFLGESETNFNPPAVAAMNELGNNNKNNNSWITTGRKQPSRPPLFKKVTENPYNKKRQANTKNTASKSTTAKKAQQASNGNNKPNNPFAQFGWKSQSEKKKSPSNNIIRNHLQQSQNQDPRAVKRQFPSVTNPAPSTAKNSFKNTTQTENDCLSNCFDYDIDEENFDASLPNHKEANRTITKEADFEAPITPAIPRKQGQEVFDLTSDTECCSPNVALQHHDDMSALGDSDYSPAADTIDPELVVLPRQENEVTKKSSEGSPILFPPQNQPVQTCNTSKYFRKNRSRRVTLDPSDLVDSKVKPSPEEEQKKLLSSPLSTPSPSIKSHVSDEIVESPLESDQSSASSSRDCPGIEKQKHRYTNRIPKNAIQAAFSKPKRMASSQLSFSQTYKKRAKIPFSQKQKSSKSTIAQPKLDSWFGAKTKSSQATFVQLSTNQSRNSCDDSLWSD